MLLAALIGGLVVNERNLLRTIVLHPLRDLMGFGYWLASYTNNRIVWRGQEYELMKEGRMHPLQVHSGAVLGNQAERLKDDPLNKEHQPALTH
jgi:hypothetical protein